MREISKIIIHHSLTRDSGTVSWAAIRDYHKSLGWSGIGYHYGVELVGDSYEILSGRFLDQIGAHAKGANRKSIGICMVGNFDDELPPIKQLNLTYRLVTDLLSMFGLLSASVFGHREIQENRTCPGDKLDMELFRFNLR